MAASLIVRIIEFCTRHALPVMVFGLLLALAAGIYTARNFAITSDINVLLSPNLEWRKASVIFRRLPELKKRLEKLEQLVAAIARRASQDADR